MPPGRIFHASPTPRHGGPPMTKRPIALALAGTLALAAPAGAKLGPNPSNAKLAGEFLRLLKAKDMPGLRAFLSPAFLLQRADGTFLTKQQYLANPSEVDSYKVSDVHGTRTGDVRVVRYTAQTDQTINGKKVTGEPVPRLSTFIKVGRTWQIVAHANFTPIPK